MGPVASQEVDQAARHQRRRFLERQRRASLREPEPAHQLPLDVPDLRHPRGPDLHLRPDGGRPAAGLGALRRHGLPVLRRGHGRLLGGSRRAARRSSKRLGVAPGLGNMEGKEVRFGVANSALYATVTTDASCGAVNSMHDSFTPAGRPRAPLQHPARRGRLRRRGRGPLRDAGHGDPVGVHRRAHGRPHPGVPGQEDRDPRGQARDALRADLPARHPVLHRLVGGGALRALVPQQRGPPRPHRDPLRLHERRRATTARPSRASAPTPPGTTPPSASPCWPGAS